MEEKQKAAGGEVERERAFRGWDPDDFSTALRAAPGAKDGDSEAIVAFEELIAMSDRDGNPIVPLHRDLAHELFVLALKGHLYRAPDAGKVAPTTAEDVSGVREIPARDLVLRALRNMRPTEPRPRWSWVEERFGLGSTYSIELCRNFGLDPHEKIGSFPDPEEEATVPDAGKVASTETAGAKEGAPGDHRLLASGDCSCGWKAGAMLSHDKAVDAWQDHWKAKRASLLGSDLGKSEGNSEKFPSDIGAKDGLLERVELARRQVEAIENGGHEPVDVVVVNLDVLRFLLDRRELAAMAFPAEPLPPEFRSVMFDMILCVLEGRCMACSWPLAESAEKGCVQGNCSFHPGEHTIEYRSWKQRTDILTLARKYYRPAQVRKATNAGDVQDAAAGER